MGCSGRGLGKSVGFFACWEGSTELPAPCQTSQDVAGPESYPIGCRLLGIHHSTHDRFLILDRQDISEAAQQKQPMLVTGHLKTPHS